MSVAQGDSLRSFSEQRQVAREASAGRHDGG